MARKRPVIIWIIKQSPSKDPNFHQMDKFLGEGRSIREPLIILNKGCVFRRGPVIIFFIYNDFLLDICSYVFRGDLSIL